MPFIGSVLEDEADENTDKSAAGGADLDRFDPEIRQRLTTLRSTHDFVILVDEERIVRWGNRRLRERFAESWADLRDGPAEHLFQEDEPFLPGRTATAGGKLPRVRRHLALGDPSCSVQVTDLRFQHREQTRIILCLDRVEPSGDSSHPRPGTSTRTSPEKPPNPSGSYLEQTPLPMLVVDLSAARNFLDQLQQDLSETEKRELMDEDEVMNRCAEKTRVVGVNQKAVSLLDAHDKRTVKKKYTKILFDTNNPDLRRAFRRVAEGSTYFETVTPQPTFSGRVRHVRLAARVGGTQHDDWNRVYVTLQDVTERVREERQLRLSEARFQSLFEHSPISLWVLDFSRVKKYLESLKERVGTKMQGFLSDHPEEVRECVRRMELIDVNRAGLEMTGFDSKQQALEHHREWLLSMDPEFFYPELLHVARGDKQFTYETSFRTYEGNRKVIELHWSIPSNTLNGWSRVYLFEIDLTDRKKVQNKLEQREQLFRTLFEQAPTGINLSDSEGRFVRVNQSLVDMLGYTRRELEGMGFWEITHSGDLEENTRKFERLQAGEIERFSMEKRLLTKDGSVIWTKVHNSPVNVSTEGPGRHITVVNDITEQKRTNRYNQRLLETLDATPDFFAAAQPDGEIFYLNGSLEEVFGEQGEPGRAMNLFDVHPESVRERLRKEAVPEAEKTGKWVGETSLLTPDGEEIPVSQVLLCHRDEDGELRSYSTLMRDISESRRIRRELEESESRFRQLAENIQDVFWLTSPDHKQLYYVSPEAEQFYGVPHEVLFQRPEQVFTHVHPDDRSRVRRIKTNPERIRFELEYRLAGEEGTTWIQERGFPVRDAEGEVIRIASVAEDVTRRREVEKKLRQSEKLAAIGQTAATLMHKINNPNAFIKGNLEYVLEEFSRLREKWDGRQEPLIELESAVQEALEGTLRIERFVDDMKRYTRSGNRGEVTLFDPVEMVKQTLCRLRDRWGERVNLVEGHLDVGGDVAIRGIPREFTQVIVALVENSVESRPEEEPCEVVVDLFREESELLVRIQDNGSGIEPKRQEEIFEPFHTTKAADQGIGLGLAIVRDNVNRMNGDIELRSAPGEGATFKLRFPIEVG